MNALYTIGHSNHEMENFIELLQRHGVEVLADVRSSPYSQYNPQFNREYLSRELADHGIACIFLGRELGARRAERECYVNGRVSYELVAQASLFREGIDRVLEEIRTRTVALMCAEKDPLDCHRLILVGRHLRRRGVAIRNILEDGHLESIEESEKRLMDRLKIEPDFFTGYDQLDVLIERAYDEQGQRIAYKEVTEAK